MEDYYTQLMKKIRAELRIIDLDGCDISIEESLAMVDFLKKCLDELRDFFLSKESITTSVFLFIVSYSEPPCREARRFFSKR